jgi:hypothetical protein
MQKFISILHKFYLISLKFQSRAFVDVEFEWFLTRLSPKLASTEQFNKQAVGIRQSIEGLIGNGLPENLGFKFISNSTLKLTH